MRWTRVVVESVPELQRALAHPDADAKVRCVHLTVADWSPPVPGWSGRLGRLPDVLRLQVRLPRQGRGRVRIRLALAEAIPLRRVLAAVLSIVRPTGGLLHGPIAEPKHTAEPHHAAQPDPSAEPNGVEPAVTTDSGPEPLRLDLGLVNPRGRSAEYGPTCPQGQLELAGGRWRVVTPDLDRPRVLVGWRELPELDADAYAVARELGVLHGDHVPVDDPALAARLVALFAAVGVICHWPALPVSAQEMLGPKLWSLVAAELPDTTAGAADWEARSVAQRRAAMRVHGAEYAWTDSAKLVHVPIRRPPVSALLVTSRRAALVPAVRQVLRQTYPRLEVVVGIHGGQPDVYALNALRAEAQVPVDVQSYPESWSLRDVVVATAGRASGSLLTRFDDEVEYGPEHAWDLVLARTYSRATLVGKPLEFTRHEPLDVTVRQSRGPTERYTDQLDEGALLISRADLDELGAGQPAAYALDAGLAALVRRDGGLAYVTHGLDVTVRRGARTHHKVERLRQ